MLKQLSKQLPENDSNSAPKILVLSKELNEEIDTLIREMHILVRVLIEICREAASSTTMMAAEGSEGLTAKKLEDFAYQACDKFYPKDDTGPYENLRYKNKAF